MDREGGERAGYRDEQEDEQAVIGAAALGDRHDREPLTPDCAGIRAPTRLPNRRQGIDEEARQDAGEQAERSKQEHGGQREPIGLRRALGRRRARAAEERMPNALTKQAAASAAESASNAPTAGTMSFRPQTAIAGSAGSPGTSATPRRSR